MAKLRTTANRITEGIEMNRRRLMRWVFWVGFPVAGAASYMWPDGNWAWVLAWLVCFQLARRAGSPIELAGAKGEERALAILSGLPEEYTLFNQIRLPDKRSRTGFREADFMVVGPNGIFLIENKDYRGEIRGDDSAAGWELHKIGIGGTPYTKPCRNPVPQVRVYVALLGAIFARRSIRARITPLVSLSQNNNLRWITSEKVKVVRLDDLTDTILGHQGKLDGEEMEQVVDLLEELSAGTFNEKSGAEGMKALLEVTP
ncbi:MAG: nuclease-related domain-containing protein [Geobacteraceae bacterium]